MEVKQVWNQHVKLAAPHPHAWERGSLGNIYQQRQRGSVGTFPRFQSHGIEHNPGKSYKSYLPKILSTHIPRPPLKYLD